MTTNDAAHFRQVLGHFPTGVTIITAIADGEPVGFAVGSFFSVSLDPALVGFCAGKASSTWPAIRDQGSFCVNVLSEGQEAVCRQLATHGVDKFAGIGWTAPAGGPPRLDDALAWIDCSIEAIHDAGDHEICVGRVRELEAGPAGGPLVFYRGGYGRFAV